MRLKHEMTSLVTAPLGPDITELGHGPTQTQTQRYVKSPKLFDRLKIRHHDRAVMSNGLKEARKIPQRDITLCLLNESTIYNSRVKNKFRSAGFHRTYMENHANN